MNIVASREVLLMGDMWTNERMNMQHWWRQYPSVQEADVNTLWLRQNGQHFTDDIFKRIFLTENVWISIKNWSLLLRVLLTIFQYWFRWWLGAVQATGHYLNHWWFVYWCIYASLSFNELTLKQLETPGNQYPNIHHIRLISCQNVAPIVNNIKI